MATEHGLPFVEGGPRVRVTPWMTCLTIATLVVSGMLARLRPGWGEALELSREHHSLSRFLSYAWIPSRETAVALADLYCLLLFGAVAEEALGALGFMGLFVAACALGGFASLRIHRVSPRGALAAVARLWSLPDLPKQRDFTGPVSAWAAGILVGVVAWVVSKLTSSVQSTT